MAYYKKYGGQPDEGHWKKYMSFQAEIVALSPTKFDLYAPDAAEKLRTLISRFLQICSDYDMMITQANFALALSISRQALQRHLSGSTRISAEVLEILQSVNNMCATAVEDSLLAGTINVVGGIFIGKNNFGYRDATEQIITHREQIMDSSELKKLADNLPDVIDGDYTEIPPASQIEENNNDEPAVV